MLPLGIIFPTGNEVEAIASLLKVSTVLRRDPFSVLAWIFLKAQRIVVDTLKPIVNSLLLARKTSCLVSGECRIHAKILA